MKKTIIFGLSGLSKGIITLIGLKEYPDFDVDYIYVDSEFKENDFYETIPIVNSLENLKGSRCVVPTFDHVLKKRWITLAEKHDMQILNIRAASAFVSKSAQIGKYHYIGQNSIIESDVVIGDHFTCGYQNRIGHDSVIGDFCHVYAQANIGGFNKIGNDVTVSSSSATREHLSIGDGAIIGMGSAVFKDVPEHHTTIGNPAKIIKRE
jgi:sugar O-acyltransferase (sialic acid O-acetyltransferase NeuD family)